MIGLGRPLVSLSELCWNLHFKLGFYKSDQSIFHFPTRFSVVRVEVSGMRGGLWGEKGGKKLHFGNLICILHWARKIYNFVMFLITLLFILSRLDCNLLLILTLKPFFFIPVIFDQKLQGILWIFETHLGTQVTPCNLKLFQPASLGLVPLLLWCSGRLWVLQLFFAFVDADSNLTG